MLRNRFCRCVFPLVLGGAFVFCATDLSRAQIKRPEEFFARAGVNIWQRIWLGDRKGIDVASPDGRKKVVVRVDPQYETAGRTFDEFSVVAGDRRWPIKIEEGWINMEVVWAPDSEAFVMTFSERGLVGPYRMLVYFLKSGGLVVVEPTKEVLADAESRFEERKIVCWESELNPVAIHWLQSSRSLLMAVQIATHSRCDSFGTFEAYEISVPDGKILRKYGQIEAKKRFWSWLGFELRGAPNECIRNPKSCEVAFNHPEKKL